MSPRAAGTVALAVVAVALLASAASGGMAAGDSPGVAPAGGPVADSTDATTLPSSGASAADDGAVRQEVDPDAVVLRFGLRPDGDADAEVEYRVRLDDENATAAFEDLRADIRDNRSAYEARFADRMSPTVESAENATGRPMALRNVSVGTDRSFGGEYGVVTYRFEWTGFARANDTHIVAGDALAGLFLDSETRLLVGWPDGYRQVAVAPPASDSRPSAVIWSGPFEFAPGEPRVVVTNAPTTRDGGVLPGNAALVALAGVVVVAALAAALWWRREDVADVVADESGGDEPPEELLSNEEQVLRLLEERGGRVKQQEVVSALDWTEAKTSQVIGDLREAGTVEVFRIGRENVVTLPDEEL